MKTKPANPIPTTASPPDPMLSLDLEPITINADGSITPSDAPIIREDNQYKFTDDIHNPLIVEADSIVIDGQGHLLDGRGTINDLCVPKSQVGIDLFNVNNVIVEDIHVRNFKVGVFIDDSDNIKISENKVTYNYFGIISYNSTNSTINDNKAASNNQCGIYLEYCLNDNAMNNQLQHNGVILYYSSGNIISNNEFKSGGLHPYNCENLLISGNSFHDHHSGISITTTLNTTIAANSLPESTVPIVTNGVSSLLVFMNNFSNYSYTPKTLEGTLYINGEIEILTNLWDNGTLGNYWNNYTEKNPNATEVGSSGVWDTPYDIYGNNTDNHPLVAPISANEMQALSQLLIAEHIPSTELTMVESYSIDFQYSEIPEFLSWIIIPLFLIGTGLGISYRSRLRRNR